MDTQPSISETIYRIANGAQFLIGGPPDSKGHGANMGPHVGPMNFAIWGPSLLLDWIPFYWQRSYILQSSLRRLELIITSIQNRINHVESIGMSCRYRVSKRLVYWIYYGMNLNTEQAITNYEIGLDLSCNL